MPLNNPRKRLIVNGEHLHLGFESIGNSLKRLKQAEIGCRTLFSFGPMTRSKRYFENAKKVEEDVSVLFQEPGAKSSQNQLTPRPNLDIFRSFI